MAPGFDDVLANRDLELAQVDHFLSSSSYANGLLVEGPPGIGKSRLLAEGLRRVGGKLVLHARASEVERTIPFGIVRQLLEPVLVTADAELQQTLLAGAGSLAQRVLVDLARPSQAAGDDTAVLHGLYWFTANLVSRRPTVMIVDDVHWADRPSWRWLAYLARRIDGLDLRLLLASRPREVGEADELWDGLSSMPGFQTLRPRRLNEAGVAELIQLALSSQPSADFVAAVQQLTGGNPFLVREVLRELSEAAVAPTSANATVVDKHYSRSVGRSVSRRLQRLSPACVDLCQAAAVLGDGWQLATVAAVAGLDHESAVQAADSLSTAYLMHYERTVGFVHPLVRSSVYAELTGAQRNRMHHRAASALTDAAAPDERIAAQLLFTEAASDPATVEVLVRAGQRSMSRGATDVAVQLLRRALAEPPPVEGTAEVALTLGRAERLVGEVLESIGHLRLAVGRAADARVRGLAAAELCTSLMYSGEQNEAPVLALLSARDALPESERELGLKLESLRSLAAEGSLRARQVSDASGVRFHADPAAPRSPSERIQLAAVACNLAYAEPAAIGRDLAMRAIQGHDLVQDPGPGEHAFFLVPFALTMNGAIDEGLTLLTETMQRARAIGSAFAFAQAVESRSYLWWLKGSLAEAEADAELALTYPGSPVRPSANVMMEVRLARGDVAGAAQVWRDERLDDVPALTRGAMLTLWGRAHLSMASRRPDEALETLLTCGRLEEQWAVTTPALTMWRGDAARILAGQGRRDEACRLVDEEVERARRFGAQWQLGAALEAAGSVIGAAAGLRSMEEAVAVLAESPARLAEAKASYELGAALRRLGRRVEARLRLTSALELSLRCGATALSAAAHDELVAAGAKPRRDPLSRPLALTASELRVARLARDGLSNREIAQALFVTEKTIEVHLTSSYRKLGIASRTQLARSLTDAPSRRLR